MSNKQTSQAQDSPILDAEMIAEYLHQNPEFFEQNPDVLAELNIGHHVNGAISMVERQIIALREQNSNFKIQLDGLIKIARDNDKLNEQVHKLILSLMDANNLNDIYIALDDSLRGDFETDAVTVKLFVDMDSISIDPDNDLIQTIFVPMEDSQLNGFKTILGREKPVCGSLTQDQLSYMFGDQADAIKSTALIPLGGDFCATNDCNYLGIIAIGSHDENRFHAKIGTLFLSNLGDIISRAIRPYVNKKHTDE